MKRTRTAGRRMVVLAVALGAACAAYRRPIQIRHRMSRPPRIGE